MKRNTLISCFLLLSISISSKTFSQNQTLSIVSKADRIDTLDSSPRLFDAMQYNRITQHDGKHICYVNYRVGVIDAAGNVIIPEGREVIERIGDVFKIIKSGQYRLIDGTGKTIHEYDVFTKMDNCDFYRVLKNKKYGVVNSLGKEIIPCLYDVPCKYINIESGDFFRVEKDKNRGIIDASGKMIIPLEYDVLFPAFDNSDVFVARKGNYFGCIDKNNRVLLDFKYIYINPFVNGVAEACESEELIMVNNPLRAKRLENNGYVWLQHPYRYMGFVKNPVYSQIKIEDLKTISYSVNQLISY